MHLKYYNYYVFILFVFNLVFSIRTASNLVGFIEAVTSYDHSEVDAAGKLGVECISKLLKRYLRNSLFCLVF